MVTNRYKYLQTNFSVICPYDDKLSVVTYFPFVNGIKKNTFFAAFLSCVKIQKITNMLNTLGQIMLYMGPVNKNPKKKKN